MRKRTSVALVVALAAMALPAALFGATASYSSLTLKVSYGGPKKTVVTAAGSPADDATAAVAIYLPTGTTVKTGQAAGATIGTVQAQAVIGALGGAVVPLTGKILVAPAGAVSPADQARCLQDATPLSTWLLQLTAAGQVIQVPAYVLATAGAETGLGPAKIVACLPPPDIPVDKGGAPNGAKIVSASFTLNDVVSQVREGVWLAFWTPWQPGTGQVNQAGVVATPAAVAPGAITVKARKTAGGAVVSGRVTQGGQGRPGATVTIWGAKGRAALKKLGAVRSSATGAFSFRARAGDVFQARAVAGVVAAQPLCQLVGPRLAGVPCLNPTANGFAVSSGLARSK